MGSRLGRRVIQFANLPIKLIMPTKTTNITEISLKTIPSATKIEIKRVLQSLYGFNVDKVRTLNMEGKKKKRGGLLIARPDYKKAYVTLLTPLSLSPEVFPLKAIAEAQAQRVPAKPAVVEGGGAEPRRHWLHGREDRQVRVRVSNVRDSIGRSGDGKSKFPWSAMRSGSSGST